MILDFRIYFTGTKQDRTNLFLADKTKVIRKQVVSLEIY